MQQRTPRVIHPREKSARHPGGDAGTLLEHQHIVTCSTPVLYSLDPIARELPLFNTCSTLVSL